MKTKTKEIRENYPEYIKLIQYAADLRAELYSTEDRITAMETSMASKKLIERFNLEELKENDVISAWEFRFFSGMHRYKNRLSTKQTATITKIIEREHSEELLELYNYLTSKLQKDENNDRKGE